MDCAPSFVVQSDGPAVRPTLLSVESVQTRPWGVGQVGAISWDRAREKHEGSPAQDTVSDLREAGDCRKGRWGNELGMTWRFGKKEPMSSHFLAVLRQELETDF